MMLRGQKMEWRLFGMSEDVVPVAGQGHGVNHDLDGAAAQEGVFVVFGTAQWAATVADEVAQVASVAGKTCLAVRVAPPQQMERCLCLGMATRY